MHFEEACEPFPKVLNLRPAKKDLQAAQLSHERSGYCSATTPYKMLLAFNRVLVEQPDEDYIEDDD